jgi:DNA polymerase-3 subunit gamma/tau
MSLYRKYRPMTFADVVGQDHAVDTLKQAVAQGKLAHAYLFAGSRGTGKTSVARILAKSMLTQGMEDETLKRQIITGVEDGSLVDLVEIDAASNRGIDDIRLLVEKIQFTPVVARAKVYIIDEVHMLTREAFNALLKTLEEPPAYAYFILATTELQKIPATIQSRCQRFTFRQIKEDDIIQALQKVADAEKIPIDRPALRLVAHHAQGGMRDALSLLDQLRSLPQVTAEEVRQRIGESGQQYVESVFDAIAASDRHALIDIVRHVEQAGIALDTFGRQLLGEARERMHTALAANQPIAIFTRISAVLLEAVRDIRYSPVPGLVLEAAFLTLCDAPEPAATAPAPRAPAKAAPAAPAASAPSAPTPAPAAVPPAAKAADAPAPAAPTTFEAPALTMQEVEKSWARILQDVTPASTKMSLKNARPHSIRGNILVLTFGSAFHRDKVGHTDSARGVEEVLEKVFKKPIRIECLLEEERGPVPHETESVNLADAASEIF